MFINLLCYLKKRYKITKIILQKKNASHFCFATKKKNDVLQKIKELNEISNNLLWGRTTYLITCTLC